MAPKYAPSLRARLPPLAFLLQVAFIVIFAFCVKIEDDGKDKGEAFIYSYAKFQDIHVMVFLGFGFLGTFLVRYGFSSSAFSLLVAAMAVQWATILKGFLLSHSLTWKFGIQLRSLLDAELCAASTLVAMGTVHGKTNPVQLLIFGLIEVTGFVLNQWIIQTFQVFQTETQTPWLYSIVLINIFGALFGMITSHLLFRNNMQQKHEKEKVDRRSGLFAMFGTLFLWMFWPSLNSVLELNVTVICSTYLALAVSAVTAMAVSALCSSKGKINLVHVQNSLLSGGIAVGAVVTAPLAPWIAMTIGLCATLLSTLGFRYLKKHMLFAFDCHDTLGVLCAHALPGILGWFAQLILRLSRISHSTVAVRFAVHHICILLITVCVSLVMGIITGIILKWSFWKPQRDNKCYDDQAYWEFPHLLVDK
ncbi:rh blood group, D antigen isoform X2 [Tachysurus vachellii]|uniref:rh blood group, D antigen isoform X2 n=1 Tax=Tachysurus vachellii TaxID=175792 RepID=UPI00296B4A21|nr:rh blood group, D antigen isoform X2 [Tachysurus vachellii]